MAESSPNGEKTLWEKEKLLVTSNFSFSHSVFKRPILQTRKNQGLFGKGLMVKQMYLSPFTDGYIMQRVSTGTRVVIICPIQNVDAIPGEGYLLGCS